jgi:hypothetical protein
MKHIALNLKGLICQTIAMASPQVTNGINPYQPVLQFFMARRFCKSIQAIMKSNAIDGIRNHRIFLKNTIKSRIAKYSKPNNPRTISCPFSNVSKNGTIVMSALAISG